MLPREERIGTRDFRTAFENGRAWRNNLLQMRVFRRAISGKDRTRAAFVVTKKTGKAVVRNRLRRRVREIYRLSEHRNDARFSHTDLLIFASQNALAASNEELKKSLEDLLAKAARNQSATQDGNVAARETKNRRGENRQSVRRFGVTTLGGNASE